MSKWIKPTTNHTLKGWTMGEEEVADLYQPGMVEKINKIIAKKFTFSKKEGLVEGAMSNAKEDITATTAEKMTAAVLKLKIEQHEKDMLAMQEKMDDEFIYEKEWVKEHVGKPLPGGSSMHIAEPVKVNIPFEYKDVFEDQEMGIDKAKKSVASYQKLQKELGKVIKGKDGKVITHVDLANNPDFGLTATEIKLKEENPLYYELHVDSSEWENNPVHAAKYIMGSDHEFADKIWRVVKIDKNILNLTVDITFVEVVGSVTDHGGWVNVTALGDKHQTLLNPETGQKITESHPEWMKVHKTGSFVADSDSIPDGVKLHPGTVTSTVPDPIPIPQTPRDLQFAELCGK